MDEINVNVDSVDWRKTNYIRPHEYFLKKENPDLFNQLCKLIKEYGEKGQFQGATYTYLYYKDYKYWHMGIVINREKCTPKCK